MNDLAILVEVPIGCPLSRNGDHRGSWSPCDPIYIERVLVHRTRFICRLCGSTMQVLATDPCPGDALPEPFL